MTFERIEANVPLLHEELSGFVRQTAFEVHQYFGPGFLEKVYANALAHRGCARRVSRSSKGRRSSSTTRTAPWWASTRRTCSSTGAPSSR